MNHQEVLIQRTREYLDSQNWHYDVRGEENNAFTFGLNIGGKLGKCRMLVIVHEKDIQATAIAPLSATEEVYASVVEFITRANYGLKIGKFEFDYRDGEVSYQTCLPCSAGVPAMEDVERVVDISYLMLKRYGDGLVKNLMGFGQPEADIEEIEK